MYHFCIIVHWDGFLFLQLLKEGDLLSVTGSSKPPDSTGAGFSPGEDVDCVVSLHICVGNRSTTALKNENINIEAVECGHEGEIFCFLTFEGCNYIL